MMGFIHVAVAVLCLLACGQSAPVTTCENLIQRIDIRGTDQLLGSWTMLSESTNVVGSKLFTNMFVDSAWVKVSATNETDVVSFTQTQKMFGRCFSLSTMATLKDNTLSISKPVTVSEVLLRTSCPDCLVIQSNNTIGGNIYTGLQLLSRRNKVTAAEQEEFTKQVECLNLPAPVFLDLEKGLCPDESPSQETETTDLTRAVRDMGSEVSTLLDKLITSRDGVNTLTKMILGNVSIVETQDN